MFKLYASKCKHFILMHNMLETLDLIPNEWTQLPPSSHSKHFFAAASTNPYNKYFDYALPLLQSLGVPQWHLLYSLSHPWHPFEPLWLTSTSSGAPPPHAPKTYVKMSNPQQWFLPHTNCITRWFVAPPPHTSHPAATHIGYPSSRGLMS